MRSVSLRAQEKALKNFLSTANAESEFLFVVRENHVPVKSHDIAKMKGYVNTFRDRIGDIRIVYEIQWNQRAINVLNIKSRENVYE